MSGVVVVRLPLEGRDMAVLVLVVSLCVLPMMVLGGALWWVAR